MFLRVSNISLIHLLDIGHRPHGLRASLYLYPACIYEFHCQAVLSLLKSLFVRRTCARHELLHLVTGRVEASQPQGLGERLHVAVERPLPPLVQALKRQHRACVRRK